jgi:hypothetical protein
MTYIWGKLRTTDTSKITISMWVNFSGDGPLLQFGPQTPFGSVDVSIGGSLGLGECFGNAGFGPAGCVGHQEPASISTSVGGASGSLTGDGPFSPFCSMGAGTASFGIEGTDDPITATVDVAGGQWVPEDESGGTAWSVGDMVYDSGLIRFVATEYGEHSNFVMSGGSKMPQQPSGLCIAGSGPFFIASSRCGIRRKIDDANTIPGEQYYLGVPINLNQKVLRPKSFITAKKWHHIFVNWDGSEAGWSIVVDGEDISDHGKDGVHSIGSWQSGDGADVMAVKDAHVGLPIVPDCDGIFCNNVAGWGPWNRPYGPSAEVEYSKVEVWFDKFIAAPRSDDNRFFQRVYRGDKQTIVPPKDRFAAQKGYGKSDLFFYRDGRSGHKFEKNTGTGGSFELVGDPPTDYFPGPGQGSARSTNGGASGGGGGGQVLPSG